MNSRCCSTCFGACMGSISPPVAIQPDDLFKQWLAPYGFKKTAIVNGRYHTFYEHHMARPSAIYTDFQTKDYKSLRMQRIWPQ